ncbi:MAG TPA: penicillin-binding protein 2 [Bacteroidales bacterium]|jgi:penicillin-binding protein 2|nr:penicillin-binding protein 2 [Bacteroidales bacterium]HRT14043.1 penicillin-binding protein 2 [Bacteroidales bacterium]
MENLIKKRYYVILFIIFGLVAICLIRLFHIQILDPSYKKHAEQNALRHLTEHPERGLIYDRNDSLLVYNEVAYDLMIVPNELRTFDTNDLCRILDIDKEILLKRIEKAKAYSMLIPTIFEQQMSKEDYGYVEEKLYKFPGFFVQNRTLRSYPHPVAAHIFGYVGEVSQKILDNDPYYQLGDYIGISGIEKAYEPELRGVKGKRVVLVDVHNRERGSYNDGELDQAPVAGTDLWSSIDLRLQIYAERLLNERSGSIVAIEPATGEILCIVSSPSYDPNLLVGKARGKNYRLLQEDKKKNPLFNRALSAMYPPGSTFKLANALIALQEGIITPSTSYFCPHGYIVGNLTVKCYHTGTVDLTSAIQVSCNNYFCRIFYNTLSNRTKFPSIQEAYNTWKKHINDFGFGQKFESDLPYETRGIIPSSDYFDKIYHKSWNGNTVISMGIGQGEVATTPIQMANFMAIIANRGYYIKPHVIRAIGKKNNPNHRYTEKHYCSIEAKHYAAVIKGMEQVMVAGTARRSKIEGIRMAGKTGTAQNPHGMDHAVFAGFAPIDNPKIAIFVLVENAGGGGAVAAPIASSIIEYYLKDETKKEELENKLNDSLKK